MSEQNDNINDAFIAAVSEAGGDANEDGHARQRRQGAERLAAQAGSAPLVAGKTLDELGDLTMAEARSVDLLASLHQQGVDRGLTPDQLADLRMGEETPEFAAALNLILDPAVTKKDLLTELFDSQIAEADGQDGAPEPEAEVAATIADDDPHLRLLNELSDLGDEDAQLAALKSILDDDDESANLLRAVADAADLQTQIDLLRAALEFDDSLPDAEGEELESLRLHNQMLALAQTNPKGAELLQALAAAETLEEQGAILEALAAGAPLPPVPDVDRNNPARPLSAGTQSALSADGMTDEVAAALLAEAGPGSLVSSRRGGWG